MVGNNNSLRMVSLYQKKITEQGRKYQYIMSEGHFVEMPYNLVPDDEIILKPWYYWYLSQVFSV